MLFKRVHDDTCIALNCSVINVCVRVCVYIGYLDLYAWWVVTIDIINVFHAVPGLNRIYSRAENIRY